MRRTLASVITLMTFGLAVGGTTSVPVHAQAAVLRDVKTMLFAAYQGGDRQRAQATNGFEQKLMEQVARLE